MSPQKTFAPIRPGRTAVFPFAARGVHREVVGIGFGEAPQLPDGDGSGFQQMTFTLTDAQVLEVKNAVQAAKAAGPFGETGNENSNGNALARIVEAYTSG